MTYDLKRAARALRFAVKRDPAVVKASVQALRQAIVHAATDAKLTVDDGPNVTVVSNHSHDVRVSVNARSITISSPEMDSVVQLHFDPTDGTFTADAPPELGVMIGDDPVVIAAGLIARALQGES